MLLIVTNALKGERIFSEGIKDGIIPYLVFGFKQGGEIEEKVRYKYNMIPLKFFVCLKDQIENIYESKLTLEEVFSSKVFEKDDLITKTGESWNTLNDKFEQRWITINIRDEIFKYNYEIDHELELIKYDMNSESDYEDYDPSSNETVKNPYRYRDYFSYDREAEFTLQVPSDGFYYFFASNCNPSSESLKLSYVVMNPGNEHLSYDLIPNKLTYLIFFITWVIVLLVSSIITGVRAWYKRNYNYLSILILVTFFFITWYWVVRYFYWMIFSREGEVDSKFDLFVKMLETASFLFYLIIINMVAWGYRIVTLEFKFFKFIKNVFIIFLLMMTTLFMEYSNFFLMIFMAVEIVGLVIILKVDINGCMHQLRESSNNLNPEVDEELEFIQINTFKLRYYRIFTLYLYCYWSMEWVVLSLRPFLELYHEWIFTLCHQILTLISMSYLFITLNYSIEVRKFEREHGGALVMPLPFNPEKDPKIWGELIVIKSVNSETQPRITIGVECFNKASKLFVYDSKPHLAERSKLYQTNNVDFETKLDIFGIINPKKSNYNAIELRNVCVNDASNSDEDVKQVKDEESSGNSPNTLNLSNDLEKKLNKNSLEKDYQLLHNFTAEKVIDFRSNRNIKRFKKIDRKCPITSSNGECQAPLPQWEEDKKVVNFGDDERSSKQESTLSMVDPDMIDIEFLC